MATSFHFFNTSDADDYDVLEQLGDLLKASIPVAASGDTTGYRFIETSLDQRGAYGLIHHINADRNRIASLHVDVHSHNGSVDDVLYCISYERDPGHVYAENTYEHKPCDPRVLRECIVDTATRGYAALQKSRRELP